MEEQQREFYMINGFKVIFCVINSLHFYILQGFPGDIGIPGQNGPEGPKVKLRRRRRERLNNYGYLEILILNKWEKYFRNIRTFLDIFKLSQVHLINFRFQIVANDFSNLL